MILLCVFLIFLDFSQGIPIRNTTNPFNQLIDDLLTSCPNYETVVFYGDFGDDIIRLAVKNQRKILPLNGTVGNVVVSPTDLLVIFLDSLKGWSKQLADTFLGINTVFVVTEHLYLDEVKMIFADSWNSSESCNVFVCSKSKNGKSVNMFTHNPYSDYAPSPFLSRYANEKLYFGQYSAGEKKNICWNLLFDRTRHLRNYPIQAVQFIPEIWMETFAGHFLITSDYLDHNVIQLPFLFFMLNSLIRSLEVSVNLTNRLKIPNPIYTEFLIQQSRLRSVDVTIQPSILVNTSLLSVYDVSYPFQFSSDVIITHHRGLMTPLEKMFNFYGWLTIIATVIIISAAFLVIYLSNNLVLSFSIFEALRLIVNVAIHSRMDSMKSRIFFSMIFLYFLIIQATFSGHLAAFLTKPEYRKNVEDLDDLKDPRYTVIYANQAAKKYITDEVLLAKTIFGDHNCNTDTIVDPQVACIDSFKMVNYLIPEYNLHYTKKALLTRFSAFLLRKNWRLKDRVNQVVMRIVDSGLVKRMLPNAGWKLRRSFRKLEEQFADNYYRPVEITDLLFIFILLGVGLLMGLLAFFGELAVQGWKNHQREIRKRWRAGKRAVKVARRMIVVKIQHCFRKVTRRKNPTLRG